METQAVLCRSIIEFEMKSRLIALVSLAQGKLGILVKDEHGSPLIPIESDFPGMTYAHAPLIVKNSMALMAMSMKSDPETLIRCFHIAVIMANDASIEDKLNMISAICGEETAFDVVGEGWDRAIKFGARVFQGARDIELTQLCALYFPDETQQIMQ